MDTAAVWPTPSQSSSLLYGSNLQLSPSALATLWQTVIGLCLRAPTFPRIAIMKADGIGGMSTFVSFGWVPIFNWQTPAVPQTWVKRVEPPWIELKLAEVLRRSQKACHCGGMDLMICAVMCGEWLVVADNWDRYKVGPVPPRASTSREVFIKRKS